MLVIVVIVLVCLVLALVIYNISLHGRIQVFQNQNKRFANLNILQNFISVIGNDFDVDKKIKTINDIMIEKYQIKYSTIVVFNDSITSGSPKYITVDNDKEKLPYQEKEFDRAKAAVFFPLYIDNVYIGYWIIESGIPHDFDDIDTTVFETVRENIVSVLKAVEYQKTIENIVRQDLFTGLNSAEYLYGEGKKIIDQYTKSAVCMFRISNIEDINRIARELGNKVIIEVSKNIKTSIAEKYIFVRYMGPKFVIVFSGVETDDVVDFINEIKESAENLKISLNENFQVEDLNGQDKKKTRKRKKKEDIQVSPSLNFVVATYYKGTGIEEVLKKMEKYLDEASKEESAINNI